MSAQREFSDGELVPGTRYRVVSLIGAGGMGSVYEVEHVELGKRFVLKALLRSLTNRDDLVHRLRNEWRALGKLEHPNIVGVTDAGVTTTGLPYFVMERLQGETLGSRLRRERRLPLGEALAISADILDGLSAAHRIGIVHRDVKPPNVFLVKGRRAKLLDFGIAKVLDPKASQITGRGMAIGTPRYMSPEQATGEAVDGRTDLYAVGLLLFEMIAGTGPFDTLRDPNELFLAHIGKPAPALSSVAPFVPQSLDAWVARLLAKRPFERPADAAEVSNALRALAAGPPRVQSPPPPKEDATLAGGPFDALEAAPTVPSDSPMVLAANAATRTSVGAPPSGPQPPMSWSARTNQSGETLRLDALGPDSDRADAPTRTAAPSQPPDTPPPVSEAAFPAGPERRWLRWIVLAACTGSAAAAGMIAVRRAPAPEVAAAASPSPPPRRMTAARTAPPPAPVTRPEPVPVARQVAVPTPASAQASNINKLSVSSPPPTPTSSPSTAVRAAPRASAHQNPARSVAGPTGPVLPSSGL